VPNKKQAIFYIFVTAIVVLAGFLTVRVRTGEKTSKEPNGEFSINLDINNQATQTVNLPENEAAEIEKELDIFEKFKFKKDFVSAVGLFTPPGNADEKQWLDHLLGNDLTSLNDSQPSPRFLNKDNFHLLAGYDIEKIEKKDDTVYTYVKELRVLNTSKEGEPPDYKTDIQNLIFEMVDTDNGLIISRYYHTKPTSSVNLKYEGFISY